MSLLSAPNDGQRLHFFGHIVNSKTESVGAHDKKKGVGNVEVKCTESCHDQMINDIIVIKQ